MTEDAGDASGASRSARGSGSISISVLNPLGASLSHYTSSLRHVVGTCGVSTHALDVIEPSSASYGRSRWLSSYLHGAHRQVRQEKPDAIIASWPALGYWDLPLLAAIAPRIPIYLVMHDPQPLVYALGYGKAARATARLPSRGTLLVHSPDAARVVVDLAEMPRVFEVLHPMFPPQRGQRPSGETRNIRVMGQFKPDRDIDGLRRLAEDAPSHWQLDIIGRGWPEIAGWRIRNEFVSEEEFDQLISTSHAVLIPYSRFFQSGVAVRALEWGVPVVGPYESSLQIALGKESPWLVRDGDWVSSVSAAADRDRGDAYRKAGELYDQVLSSWSALLDRTRLGPRSS